MLKWTLWGCRDHKAKGGALNIAWPSTIELWYHKTPILWVLGMILTMINKKKKYFTWIPSSALKICIWRLKKEFSSQKITNNLNHEEFSVFCKRICSEFNTDFRNYEYSVTIANPDIRGNFFLTFIPLGPNFLINNRKQQYLEITIVGLRKSRVSESSDPLNEDLPLYFLFKNRMTFPCSKLRLNWWDVFSKMNLNLQWTELVVAWMKLPHDGFW